MSLVKSDQAQVFSDHGSLDRLFCFQTIAHMAAMHHSIGILLHTYPNSGSNQSKLQWDENIPFRSAWRSKKITKSVQLSPDGVNRVLADVQMTGVQ